MTLHWWNTDKLVEQLCGRGVSELETARYAMLGAVLYFQMTYLATWYGGNHGWLLIYEFVVVTLIGVVAVNECFESNGGSQGCDFLKRFTVLSVPIGVKVGLASIVLGQVLYFGFPYVVDPSTFRDPAHVYQLVSFGFASAFTCIYYWRIYIHLSRVSRRLGANTLAEKEPAASPLL